MKLTVVRQKLVPARWDECWPYLSEPHLLGEWFADTDQIRIGEPFRFDFGDGDFFAGRVVHVERPCSLFLEWRFMDVGPMFEIHWTALPAGDGETEITVRDRGATTVEEARGLQEGWEDFLMRLEQRLRTGQPCRYRWTEVLGATAFAGDTPELREALSDADWWRMQFPGEKFELHAADGEYTLVFSATAWGPVRTEAKVKLSRRDDLSCVSFVHQGWSNLAFGMQVPERARFARMWAKTLKVLETASHGAERHISVEV